jgi:NTE family protein
MSTIRDAFVLPRPIAFVFGGGATSAAAQVGMLDAALHAGIRPDLVVGTSAGALNGAVLAERPGGAAEHLKRVWTTCGRSKIVRGSRIRVLRNMLRGHYMFDNTRLEALFTEEIAARDFADLEIPFACVATDIDSGDPVVLRDGDLMRALLATCAIPGVFPLVEVDDRPLADGGYVANVPVRQALDLGAASLVVFDGRPRIVSRGRPRDVRDSTTAAFAAALKQQHENDIAYARRHVPILCPPGQPRNHVKGFDFTHVQSTIAGAYAAAAAYFAGGAAECGRLEVVS